MSISDLFSHAKEHPYLVALGLLTCLAVGVFGSAVYVGVTEARLGTRDDRVSVMDERLKLQEEAAKKQRHINKLVQEQITGLKKGFEGLPIVVTGLHSAVKEGQVMRTVNAPVRQRLSNSLDELDRQVLSLQTAVRSAEALSQALDLLVSGITLEEEGRYAQASAKYADAARAGIPEAYFRSGMLSFYGKGVPQDKEAAIADLERAALLGSAVAKVQLALLFTQGKDVPKDIPRAEAILAVDPKLDSSNQLIRDARLDRYLSEHRQLSANALALATKYRSEQRELLAK